MGLSFEAVYLQHSYAKEAAQALNLQQWHLRKLKSAFESVDLDKSGTISLEEMFISLGEIKSPFTDKLFELIDIDASGSIEFEEYVHVMATYCMFTK
jgi:Ca2+-binding EF-hand superfamily protein